jgi:hypothetical protein
VHECTVELTPDDVGDVSASPDLLDQIEGPARSVTADGAYDGDDLCWAAQQSGSCCTNRLSVARVGSRAARR